MGERSLDLAQDLVGAFGLAAGGELAGGADAGGEEAERLDGAIVQLEGQAVALVLLCTHDLVEQRAAGLAGLSQLAVQPEVLGQGHELAGDHEGDDSGRACEEHLLRALPRRLDAGGGEHGSGDRVREHEAGERLPLARRCLLPFRRKHEARGHEDVGEDVADIGRVGGAVVADGGDHVGVDAVGDTEGDGRKHQEQRARGDAAAARVHGDDGERDEGEVEHRVPHRDRCVTGRVAALPHDGLEDEDPAHGPGGDHDDGGIDEPASVADAFAREREDGEAAEEGDVSAVVEDVGEPGEGGILAEAEVVVGVHEVASGPRRQEDGEGGPAEALEAAGAQDRDEREQQRGDRRDLVDVVAEELQVARGRVGNDDGRIRCSEGGAECHHRPREAGGWPCGSRGLRWIGALQGDQLQHP